MHQADHDGTPANWPRKPGDVGLDRQGFEVDDAQQELAAEDAKLERQAIEQLYATSLCMDEIRDLAGHGVGVLLDGELREDAFEGGQLHEGAQTLDGVVGYDLAAMKDDDAGTDALDGVEFVGAEEHDFAAVRPALE